MILIDANIFTRLAEETDPLRAVAKAALDHLQAAPVGAGAFSPRQAAQAAPPWDTIILHPRRRPGRGESKLERHVR